MYTNEIAPLFNSEIINKLCEKIDNKHPNTTLYKKTLLYLMRNSVDLSNRHSIIDKYRKAYNRVQRELYADQLKGGLISGQENQRKENHR